ncbi:phosphatidylinositol alpha-1,6-mannosyltransferase [Luteibacter sp. HA06]
MERLNAHMAEALSAEYRVTVIAPKGSRIDDAPSVRVVCCPFPGLTSYLLWGLFAGMWRAFVDRPSLILGGSGLVAPLVLTVGWLSGVRHAVYLHGLDIVVTSQIYRMLWLPAIRRVNVCVVNSHNTRDLAIRAGVNRSRLRIVFPGVSLPVDLSDRRADAAFFRTKHGLGSGPIVLSVGRLTNRKGLVEFIERALLPLLELQPDARLVVVGDEAPDALNASGVGQLARVEAALRSVGASASVRLLGPVSESELRAAFSAATVHVFPGIEVIGDVEGFGMVSIEAAAYGVPTVAFAVGGVADAIDDPASGSLVRAGDYKELVQRLVQRMTEDDTSVTEKCRKFAAGFAWPVFAESIREALAPEIAE